MTGAPQRPDPNTPGVEVPAQINPGRMYDDLLESFRQRIELEPRWTYLKKRLFTNYGFTKD